MTALGTALRCGLACYAAWRLLRVAGRVCRARMGRLLLADASAPFSFDSDLAADAVAAALAVYDALDFPGDSDTDVFPQVESW